MSPLYIALRFFDIPPIELIRTTNKKRELIDTKYSSVTESELSTS